MNEFKTKLSHYSIVWSILHLFTSFFVGENNQNHFCHSRVSRGFEEQQITMEVLEPSFDQ